MKVKAIFLLTSVILTLVLILAFVVVPSLVAQPKQQFTEWGWPLPYEKVSEKSINYLKEKGWWPLKYAYQPPWMAQATVPWIIKKLGLEKERVGNRDG